MNRQMLASTTLIIVAVVGLGWWLSKFEEFKVIDIMAPDSEDAKVPVYAQFTVTQTIVLPEMVEVVKLDVPMDVPDAGLPFFVRLRKDGEVVDLTAPRRLVGELEVEIDGREITHDDRERAPRVFVESDDAAYPDGNYRIAANEKVGDVELTLTARQRRWERIVSEWQDRPLDGVIAIGWGLLGVLVLAGLLGLLQRIHKRTLV